MERITFFAIGFLGFALISVIIGFIVYVLSVQHYGSHIKYKNKNKEIEVTTNDSNSTTFK